MDKEQAKFILQSFRPDGADAKDPDFAEALSLAAENRELGEWLTQERARDAAFASALNDLPIPKDLRDAIFEMFGDQGPALTEFDSAFVGALATVTPPAGLRDQILNTMAVEQKVARPQVSSWKKWSARITVAAATLAISVLALFKFAGPDQIAGESTQELHQSAIAMLQNPLFSLDLTDKRQERLYNWLKSEELPSPESLPAGLAQLDGVGCKYLELGDRKSRASLICFRLSEDTVVHLVMLKKEVFSGVDFPALAEANGHCVDCQECEGWATTQWTDQEHAFFLFSQMEPTRLAALFE